MTAKDIVKLIKKVIKPLRNRVYNMVRLAKLILITDGATQSLQVVSVNNEVIENVKFIETYGLTAKPRGGSETIIFNVQGNLNNVVALNIGSRQFRFKELKPGEVCLYDENGSRVHLKNGSIIDVIAAEVINAQSKTINVKAAETVNIEAQNVNLTASKIASVSAKQAVVNADTTTINGKVNLAGGGAGVAFLGCAVKVDPNTHEGTIVSASTEVTTK